MRVAWNKGLTKKDSVSINNMANSRTGNKHWNYSGGVGNRNKYRTVLVNGKYLLEHRLIMESYLGRKLNTNEVVHHKNGNMMDNNISNLELLNNKDHMKKHWKENANYNTQKGKKALNSGQRKDKMFRLYAVGISLDLIKLNIIKINELKKYSEIINKAIIKADKLYFTTCKMCKGEQK